MSAYSSILIIDDNPPTLHILTDLFLKEGFHKAMGMTTGAGAIEIIREKKPEIILLNADMKGEDSMKILNQIKVQYPPLPIIMFTDKKNERLAEKILHFEACSYIVRSAPLADIVKDVRAEMEKHLEEKAKRETRILLIDDDKGLADMVRNFLETNGYRCSVLYDARRIFEAIKAYRPSLIFLDIVMPDSDGIDLLQQIKSIEKDIKVVMVSGVSDKEVCIEAMKRGAAGYITKPFSLQQIGATVVTTMLKG